LTNEKLAHELILDPEFELKPDKNSLEAQVKLMARRAFFDQARQFLASSKFDWAIEVLADMKQQLIEMVPASSPARKEIDGVIDLDLIKQQAENGKLDLQKYLQAIGHFMAMFCAPVRDASIRALSNVIDIPKAMETILDILDDMKLDLANFRLRNLRPHLMQQAVEYERGKFQRAYDSKSISIKKTEQWLQSGARAVKEIASQRNPQNIDIPENRVRFETVYFDALLSLVFSADPIRRDSVAETLLMDVERLVQFQNEAQAVTIVSALIMLTRNFFPELRDERTAAMKMKKNLFILLKDSETSIDHLANYIISLANDILARSNRSVTEEQMHLVRNMVNKTLSFKDTVFLLLNRRIRDSVRVQLVSGRFRRDSNNGLEFVQEEMEALSHKIFIMARHNRDVYAPWYDKIISAALA